MKFFIMFVRIENYSNAESMLLDFKKKINEKGEMQVFDTIESTYDRLFNMFAEKSTADQKGRGACP